MSHTMQMLLRALQHPQADSVQLDALRNLVPWLEDRKIRAYKLPDRSALASTESSDWQGVYDTVGNMYA
jgi:RNA transcription, translation and transport factor protein